MPTNNALLFAFPKFGGDVSENKLGWKNPLVVVKKTDKGAKLFSKCKRKSNRRIRG